MNISEGFTGGLYIVAGLCVIVLADKILELTNKVNDRLQKEHDQKTNFGKNKPEVYRSIFLGVFGPNPVHLFKRDRPTFYPLIIGSGVLLLIMGIFTLLGAAGVI